MKDIPSRYDPRNVFNADEAGLFGSCFHTTVSDSRERNIVVSDRRRVYLCFAGHIRLKPKYCHYSLSANNPCAFKHVQYLPMKYKANKKAWIRRDLFEDSLRMLDKNFEIEERKIAMVFHNCPAQPCLKLEESWM